eukprot:8961450-Alexandrium_andersonii.AAC.1
MMPQPSPLLCSTASATAAYVAAIVVAVVAVACRHQIPAAAADGSAPAVPCSEAPSAIERPHQ